MDSDVRIDLSKYIRPPYSIPLMYFKLYYESGQREKAACELKYSFEACLRLCIPEFIHELIEKHEDYLFCAIAYRINIKGFCLDAIIDPVDFFLACSKCSAPVIALLSHHHNVIITPISNRDKLSPLQLILDRDDPDLLNRVLCLVPEFVETEPLLTRSAPLYYILENHKYNLIDEMWILINAFEVCGSDLMDIVRNWSKYCPNEPLIPILAEMYKINILNHQLEIEKYREKMFCFPTEPTSVTDLNCIDAKLHMEEAGRLREFLMNRKARLTQKFPKQYELDIIIDPDSKIILMQLPFALMKYPEFLLRSDLYMKRPLLGEEATGEGPVQDMFNFYFKQISSDYGYFDSNEKATSILPTSIGGSEGQLHEKRCVFYGLGIVFLKTLLDLRTFGNFQSKKEGLNYSLHPWIFQALLDKMQTDPKKLFHESLLFDANFYKVIKNDQDSRNLVYLTNVINRTKMYLDYRREFYRAMHDGFFLNFIEGFTPSECRKSLTFVKKELTDFYEEIKKMSPGALQLLLVGPPTINPEFLIDRFEFKPYLKFDATGNGEDIEMNFLEENKPKNALYLRSIQVFKEVMIEWCNEPGQHLLREFLKYLFGVPTLSPLHQQKWSICFDFSMENSQVLMTWACDYSVRSPIFRDTEQCKNVLTRSLELHRADPINRDMFDPEATITFD